MESLRRVHRGSMARPWTFYEGFMEGPGASVEGSWRVHGSHGGRRGWSMVRSWRVHSASMDPP